MRKWGNSPGRLTSLLRKWWGSVEARRFLLDRLRHQLGAWAGKNSRSLANRILLLQLLWALLVYLLVIAALWYATSAIIDSSVRNQAKGWVGKLDEQGTPLYTAERPLSVDEIIGELHRFPELAAVQYFNDTGSEVLAGYTAEQVIDAELPPLEPGQFESLRDTRSEARPLLLEKGRSSQLRVTAPVRIKSVATDGMLAFSLTDDVAEEVKVIGFVSAQLDYSHFYHELHDTLRNASIAIAILMLLGAGFGRLLIRWALNPLSKLQEPLTRLANGETDVHVESSGDREIAQIGMALNTTIGALRERDETLRRMANHDPLTGLYNRNCFIEQLEKEIERIAVQGGCSALMFIDLDRFKYINDTCGHAAGDSLLIDVAELLRHRMREHDVVARFGGDEFTALVTNISRKNAAEIAASLLELINANRFQIGDESLQIHFSIGLTLIDDAATSPADYLKQADAAVHQAKLSGRNRFHIYSPQRDPDESNIDTGWHKRLSRAISDEQFILYYQPLLNLGGKDEPFCEVLLRLPDKHSGVLLPGAFLPAAERFGLLAEMDLQVIDKAARTLRQSGHEAWRLSVNISEQFVEQKQAQELLRDLLQNDESVGARLVFEISEHLAVRNSERLKPLLDMLDELGCELAIDDFGAGYASFQFLKHTHAKWLKIDGTLIEGLIDDPVNQATIRAIVQSAKAMGIETVAKWVPDQRTLELLQQMGIDYAQGHFLGKPVPRLCGAGGRSLEVVM